MLSDLAIRSLPGRLGQEERRLEYPVGRGRGDCHAAHEILKTNIIYMNDIYQTYTKYMTSLKSEGFHVNTNMFYTKHTPDTNY
jgi:hypothetical protein